MGGGPGPVEGVKLEVWNYLCEFRVSNEMGQHREQIIIWKYLSCELVYNLPAQPHKTNHLQRKVLKRINKLK